ncbi:hypothetical protein PYH37_001218 [Sinorhizobium numidicum]|uniref:Uncharacterized protein n=1 Tax=Sinorhizobium numidicum TaxID=680248 RepID=A0ABY8CML2_9HYPH|nr:hypothetical protein [Sinorhizobium numidicum]WEX73869.1 hypothetical protein PYH37_001218 [Sinorhizobium numidicum]WEX79854.1 hypothetical protein PYH38_001219 [Sinorhizobium numidicum]
MAYNVAVLADKRGAVTGRSSFYFRAGGLFVHPSAKCASEPILPDELAFLRKVFKQMLEESRIPAGSVQAETMAARLIAIYQAGVRNEATLRALAKPFKDRPLPPTERALI